MLKGTFRRILYFAFLLLAFPSAAFAGFGHFNLIYTFFAHSYALVPGIPGDYLRNAFYRLTLTLSSPNNRISFGSFFAHPETRVGSSVYIGSYSIIGKAVIGDRTQIASGVQVLSGAHQHSRDAFGQISSSNPCAFNTIIIGQDCWIGAAAVIMADVGAGSTIGAGSVVSRYIPPGSTAVGSPARVIKSMVETV